MATYYKSDNKLKIPTPIDVSDTTVCNTPSITTFYTCPTGKFALFQLFQARMPVGSKSCTFTATTRGRAYTGSTDTIKVLHSGALGPSMSNFNAQSVTYKNIPMIDPFYHLRELEALLAQAELNAKCALLGPSDYVTAAITAFGGVDALNASYRIYEFSIL